jgi:hypothetical protein
MSDLEWDIIQAALDFAEQAHSTINRSRASYVVDIGDIALCYDRTRLRLIFYEYLMSMGYELNDEERKTFSDIQEMAQTTRYTRPCVVVGRHTPDSFLVCFMVSLNSNEETAASMVTELSIPCGDNQEHGLRANPPLHSRMLFALPVVRSGADLYPTLRGMRYIRQQLAYGELERARAAIRTKVAVRE